MNDNSPQFRDSEIQLAVIEAAQIGSAYILPTASDDDSPDNGVQRYELDSPPQAAGKFALDVGTKLDGAAEVKLRLSDRLDRESQAEYRVRLRAVDGGTPTPRTGTLDIVVAVLDSNDNRPMFTSDQYELTVVENSPVICVYIHLYSSSDSRKKFYFDNFWKANTLMKLQKTGNRIAHLF